MIQIIIPVFYNYDLVYKQIRHWNDISGEWELLFCDNTPREFSKTLPFDNVDLMAVRCNMTSSQYSRIQSKIKWYTFTDFDGIDGIRHGSVIDYMVKQVATTKYIGIQDSDFFWIDSQILFKVVNYFNIGYDAIGAELYYDDFGYVNDVYPDRAGWKAPCIFGMFVKRNYLLDKTFISTHYEAKVCKKETGWRVRKAMIDDGLRMIVFNAVKSPMQTNTPCFKSWFYVSVDYPGQIIGFHLIQGSGEMSHQSEQAYTNMMELCKIINKNVLKIINRNFL